MFKIKQELAKTMAKLEVCNHQKVIKGPALNGKNPVPRLKFPNKKVKQYQSRTLAHEYRIKTDNFSDGHDDDDDDDDDDDGTSDIEDTTLMMNTGRKPNVSKKLEEKNERDKDEISVKGLREMLCKMMKQQSELEIALDVFGGNLLDFHYFMAVVREPVEKKIEDPHERLTCLIK